MADPRFVRHIGDDERKLWQERITLSKRMLKARSERWDECIKRYANRHLNPVFDDTGDQVSVNVLLSNVRTKLPFLFYQEPEITVRPKQPGISDDTLALVRALNLHFFDLNKTTRKVHRAILDGLLQSYGIVKIGYSTRTARDLELKKDDQGEPGVPKKRGRKKEASAVDEMMPLRVVSEGLVHSHVSPRKFHTHSDARFPIDDHCRWVAHEVVKPLEIVKADERLGAEWRKDVKPTEGLPVHVLNMVPTVDSKELSDPHTQFVCLFEVWDKLRREVHVWADGNWDLGPARVVDWPFTGLSGFPFAMYVPLEIPETFEAMTELDPILNQVEELDRFRTMQLRMLDRYRRMYEVSSDGVDHDELDKLRTREDGDYIITNREDGQRVISPIEHASLPADSYRYEASIKNDIDVGSGVSELRRQGQGTSDTATEASIIEETQKTRTTFDRKLVDDFVVDIVDKQFAVMQQWLPNDLAVEILGPLGAKWVSPVSPQQIEGQFQFRVIPGSTSAPNSKLVRAELIGLANLLSTNPHFTDLVNWPELAKLILNTFPEITRGSTEKLLRAPEAVQGPILPRDQTGAVQPPQELPPEIADLIAASQQGGGNGGV